MNFISAIHSSPVGSLVSVTSPLTSLTATLVTYGEPSFTVSRLTKALADADAVVAYNARFTASIKDAANTYVRFHTSPDFLVNPTSIVWTTT